MATANEILLEACASGVSCLGEMDLLRIIAQGASTGGGGGGGGGTLSTDGTFAANSDLLYPSQKAAKTYIDTSVAAALTTADGLYVKKAGDTMTGALVLPVGSAAAPSLGVGGTTSGLLRPAANELAISTAGVQRLVVDAAGKVGIGTGSPGSKVTIMATAAPSAIGNVLANANAFFTYFSIADYGLAIGVTNASPILQAVDVGGITATNLSINPFGGNVGIGISAPLARLHITPSASGTDYFRIDHSDGTPRMQVGALTGSLTYGALWFGNIVPSATNYSLASDGATTLLNLPTGVGVAPTAAFHLKAGTAAANTAPQKFTPGTLLTTPELGALEFVDDGTTGHIYITVRVATVVTRVQIV